MADSSPTSTGSPARQQAAPKKGKALQDKLARALRTNLQRRKQAKKAAPDTVTQG